MRWYNNDGTVAFPQLQATGGYEDEPSDLQDAVEVSQQVAGPSSGWAEVSFDQSVAGVDGGVYLVFRLPNGSVPVRTGEGGGAGVGYTTADGGLDTWFTLDCEQWIPLSDELSIAVEPIIGQSTQETIILERSAEKSIGSNEIDQVPLVTDLRSPYPNPFNPSTKLSFTLASSSRIKLLIHDLRGRVVDTVADEVFAAGPHELSWHGRDTEGQRVGSGLYFARLVAPEKTVIRKMMLLK